jgi:hypothetical protein
MKNAEFEKGLENYLTARLAGASLAEAVSLAATNDGQVPNAKRSVIAKVIDQGKQKVTGELYLPDVEFVISTPAKTSTGTNTLEDHNALVQLVRDAFDMTISGVIDAVDAAMISAAQVSVRSWFVDSERDAQNSSMWQNTLPIRFCALPHA